jgi:tRNA (guanine37-N1)-methyltransferase
MKLKKRIEKSFSASELAHLVSAYDVVGDIAVVIIPEELEPKEHLIADAILAGNRRIKVVAKRDGQYSGEYRTIHLTILAGENRKETEVKESGIRFLVNPETVYYSVRSGNERRRLAALVQPDESVLVLFSGIAPYPLIISRYSRAKYIVGVEKNPQAHAYGIENLSRNKKITNVNLHLGDVKEVLPHLATFFDRVVMPLPTRGEEYLPYALNVLGERGFLHFYDMQHPEKFRESIDKIVSACAVANRKVLSTGITRCGHCAPQKYRICIDAMIA